MPEHDTSRISPTAHYTGYVWCRNGLSPAALATPHGRAMFWAAEGPMRIAALGTGGLTLEMMLLQRHRIIDHLLDEAIRDGIVGQVLEVAAGLSGRGLRMTRRHPELIYVESDLPGMVERKRRMLERVGPTRHAHHVIALNALVDDGPACLASAAGPLLDPTRGTAIVTEGLLSYFSERDVRGMFGRFAGFLGGFPAGLYLSDVHFAKQNLAVPAVRVFRQLLQVAARGQVQLHFEDDDEVVAALRGAGFRHAEVHQPKHHASLGLPTSRGPDLVTIVAARHDG
jgi:O-methyltransferase involved in polyketide biosynthesis